MDYVTVMLQVLVLVLLLLLVLIHVLLFVLVHKTEQGDAADEDDHDHA